MSPFLLAALLTAGPAAPEAKETGNEVSKTGEPSTAPDGEPPLPPSLGKKALCGELVRTGKELQAARRKLDDDRRQLENERSALEKLAREIADARTQLRTETERLERLLAKRPPPNDTAVDPAPPASPPPPTTPAKSAELDALAKTMKSMKPESAALLLQKSDLKLAAALLKRMKPAEAGAVMDRLKPDLAAELIALMATLPSTPLKGALK